MMLILKFLLVVAITFTTIAMVTAFIMAGIDANRPEIVETVRTLEWVEWGFILMIFEVFFLGIALVWQVGWGIP